MAAVSEGSLPVCDSELSAMMDEFEEGTFLSSLLEDRELFSYLQALPMVPNCCDEEPEDDIDLTELFDEDILLPDCFHTKRNGVKPPTETSQESMSRSGSTSEVIVNVSPSLVVTSGSESDISNLDSNDSDSVEDPLSIAPQPRKRRKIDEDKQDGLFLMSSVEHDHCYTNGCFSSENVKSPSASPLERDAPVEEDTGYETMSSSTSPGSGTTAPSSSSPTLPKSNPPLPPPSLPPIGTSHIDPVALIDARIKHFMRSQQVCLTEEEKETLKAEGLPIPTTLPLTKVEEKALKSVRRKIRNKVAAQESRKRKKEHMQELEDKVMQCTNENLRLQKKVENLETENRSLLAQLKRFRVLVAGSGSSRHTTKVGACLMVVVLCFAVLLGGWVPQKPSHWTSSISTDYATTSVRSRSLLSVDTTANYDTIPRAVCDWFRYTFLPDRSTEPPHSESPVHRSSHPARVWPEIFLSSYTPLNGAHHHNHTHNHSGSRPAIAA